MRKSSWIVIFVFLVIMTQSYLANAATVNLSPADINLASPGSTFNVEVQIDSVNNLGGFEFVVNYNPAAVTLQTASLGGFLASTGRTVTALGPTIDNGAGELTLGAFSFGANPGPNGGGALATLTFRIQQQTAGILDLSNVQLSNTSANGIVVDAEGDANLVVQASAPAAAGIPTLSEWGMIIFSLLMAGTAIWMMRRTNV